ncbi:MAG: acyltransferase family protein [Micrococcales bacterium]
MTKNPQAHSVRVDIQALRALAILAVLLYHLWPTSITGGFVGVDIFFVISGYLITGQLWRQQQKTGRVNFADFWARRARRLLPASLLAILVTTVATYLVSSSSYFLKIKDEALGATGYIQNWILIGKETDYLTADGTKSPFQHFWSLSVEEQYYIAWPILLFLAIVLVRKAPKALKLNNKVVLLAALAVMFLASLYVSVKLTYSQPEFSYFSTFTRAWEFAGGAFLAIWGEKYQGNATKRSPIWYWAGVALMLYSVFAFNNLTPFPSWRAGIPVLGAILALWGGQSESRLVPRWFLGSKPIQFLGDTSYSLYLWHWPLLILWPYAFGAAQPIWIGWVILPIAVVLGWLSKRFIEDPVRFGWLSTLKPGRQLLVAAAGMAVVIVSIQGVGALAKDRLDNSEANLKLNPPITELQNGAKALEIGDCKTDRDKTEFITCVQANPHGKVNVALIGDSHTRQYYPPVLDLANKYGWKLTLISKSACPIIDPAKYPTPLSHPSCKIWNGKLDKYLADNPPFDLIINSSSSLVTYGRAEVAAAYASEIAKIAARGTKIVVIHDNPKPGPEFLTCIERNGLASNELCKIPFAKAMRPADPMPEAVRNIAGVTIADFTNLFCEADTCAPVIGNIIVYRDNSHITTPWAKHLEPALESAIPEEFKK